jgi:dimethylhistidine N-methyltransferase
MMNDRNTVLNESSLSGISELKEIMMGLSRSQKTIPPKYLYDKRGSEIFEKITHLNDYYPTRAEKEILHDYASEMAGLIGPRALIIEPGSGACEKVRMLLPLLEKPTGYVPIEISHEILYRTVDKLHEEFPKLKVFPVVADFTSELDLPLTVDSQKGKRVVFFPGSTIGNMNPNEALQFLRRMGRLMGHRGGLLIGVDLKKDSDTFKRAYDDQEGVTAEFNLNLLERLNREVEASFKPENFQHEAFYNEKLGRVEMHLKSKISQIVKVHEKMIKFNEGETIHTENSYKYLPEEFKELCSRAKLSLKKRWMDKNELFCVYYFEKD